MMRVFLLLLFFTPFSQLYGQYYYTDWVGLQQTQKLYDLIRKNRIHRINGVGIAAEGLVTIQSQMEIPTDGKRITKTIAENNRTKELVYQFYELGRLKKIIVKNPGRETSVEYQYDDRGLLASTLSISKDSSSSTRITELHQWEYHANRFPKKMIKKTTGMDSLVVEFQTDSIGLVMEENWFKKDKKIETFYYYYNKDNYVSDIVRYNASAKKLLPDYVFEYNDKGQLINMIQVGLNGKNITYWEYGYLPNGLREIEIAKDRNKNLFISTQYQFEKH